MQNFVGKTKCIVGYMKVADRPFPSSHVPLFQNEYKCETLFMKMALNLLKMNLQAELIFIRMVSHSDSF